jgi:proteasome accessory factor B
VSAKVERLINLTVALLETRRPLTLDEIKTKVRAYGHGDPESARRMFERDKNDLRRLGIPLETVATDAFESDWGYTINRRSYELPPVGLDAGEVAALAVALHLSGEDQARVGLAKLAAAAPDPGGTVEPSARVSLGLDDLAGLSEALVSRRTVEFRYRTARGSESHRTVDPYGLAHRRGAWYLVGRDHDRGAERAFRLDRIVSVPHPVGEEEAFSPPADLDIESLTAGPVGERCSLVVAFSPDVPRQELRIGTVQSERSDGWVEVRIDDVDPERVLPRILAHGADALVVSPKEVRGEALRRLRSLRRRRSSDSGRRQNKSASSSDSGRRQNKSASSSDSGRRPK